MYERAKLIAKLRATAKILNIGEYNVSIFSEGNVRYMYKNLPWFEDGWLLVGEVHTLSENDIWEMERDPDEETRNWGEKFRAEEEELLSLPESCWEPLTYYEAYDLIGHYLDPVMRRGILEADADCDPQELARLERIEVLAEKIRESDTWNMDDCAALCAEAGMAKEWEESDGETFETVVHAAADKLGTTLL